MPDFKVLPTVNGSNVATEARANVFTSNQTLKNTGGPTVAPELHYQAYNGGTKLSEWISGIDVANNGGGVDFVLVAKADYPNPGDVADLIYVAHRGVDAPTIGLGVTPPNGSARMQISAADAEAAMGTLRLRVGASQTGKALAIHDSNPTDRLWVDKDFYVVGAHPVAAGSLAVKGDASNDRTVVLVNAAGAVFYGWDFSGNTCRFRYFNGGLTSFQVGTDGRFSSQQPPDFSGTGAQFPHAGASTPSGGLTGEVRVGTDKLWANDGGTWKSTAVSTAGAPSFASMAKWGTD